MVCICSGNISHTSVTLSVSAVSEGFLVQVPRDHVHFECMCAHLGGRGRRGSCVRRWGMRVGGNGGTTDSHLGH